MTSNLFHTKLATFFVLKPHVGEEKQALSWQERLQIALDISHGIEYLHDGVCVLFFLYIFFSIMCTCSLCTYIFIEQAVPPVIHRDLKSANILLDHLMRAKVTVCHLWWFKKLIAWFFFLAFWKWLVSDLKNIKWNRLLILGYRKKRFTTVETQDLKVHTVTLILCIYPQTSSQWRATSTVSGSFYLNSLQPFTHNKILWNMLI